MKFSENWLRRIIDPPLSSDALAQVLTMAGLEVEACEPVAPSFEQVVVSRIIAVDPHPGADRLKICQVDTGAGTVQIVCGAPNARAGMYVPCALVGARLPGASVAVVRVRGVESSGMLCSARELGLGEDQSGLLDLGAQAPLGVDLRAHLDLDDRVFTLKLTPNRGDCLSMLGLAREVAALISESFRSSLQAAVPATIADQRDVVLEAGDACPRYCGRVLAGLNPLAHTPEWIVRCLERSGIRPISPVVDVTNYVMVEMGQPLHAFDSMRLNGKVHVRFARSGERLRLLDGRECELELSHLVIADDDRPVALAGVMGGEASGVTGDTTAVFLESAFFAPEVIARVSRGLDLASDAAHRFERGVDFGVTRRALERATELILDVCGGKAGPITQADGTLPAREAIRLRPERARRVLGIPIGSDEIAAILARLGLLVQSQRDELQVTPPSFRFDLSIEEDLIEEIARVHGYERIPATLPQARAPMLSVAETTASAHALKQALAGRGYFEVVTFSFVDRELDADFAGAPDPVVLSNPIAAQMSVMRSSLIGSLVECVRFNVARKQERVRVFEVAACFSRDGDGYTQRERVAGLCYGAAMPEQWGERPRLVDFFDVRGDLEAILAASSLTFVPATHPAFHPGQTARVFSRGEPAGWIGALHPKWLQKYELGAPAVAFELDLEIIRRRELPAYQPLPKFLPVRRDLAFIVDDTTQGAALLNTIAAAGTPLVTEAELFDVYRGKGVPEGRKSLAFRVLLQDTEKMLTDAQVDGVIHQIIKEVQEKHGATIRS